MSLVLPALDAKSDSGGSREPRLERRLKALAQYRERSRVCTRLAACWAIAMAAGLVVVAMGWITGRNLPGWAWILPLVLAGILSVFALYRGTTPLAKDSELIREMEPYLPDARYLLTAAVEQKSDETSGSFSFLQWRLIEEALAHPDWEAWRERLRRRLLRARALQAVALAALLASVVALHQSTGRGGTGFSLLSGVTVSPGDTTVERGTSLVIAAQFGGPPPAEATLVLNSTSGKETRIAMARQLADPIFGAGVPSVSEEARYHVEYAGKKTRDFKIAVFDYPALLRADAQLSYPAYTGLTNRIILDTLRVSAVVGTRLTYTLQLNKAVTRARLMGEKQALNLSLASNALAVLPQFVLTQSVRYALELVDADGRSNKFATEFVLQALTNQRPQLRLTFPRGDTRVSPLQELQIKAEASDDFGLLKYGIGFGVAGQEPQIVELGQAAPANVKRQFEYTLPLEKLKLEVDQAVAYFAWADDYGPDGQPRRTYGDVFFAEVRPFEEVFRPDESGSGENSSQGGAPGGGDERARLAELQKQIVVATWNLQRNQAGPDSPAKP